MIFGEINIKEKDVDKTYNLCHGKLVYQEVMKFFTADLNIKVKMESQNLNRF